ncbi:hypothetical protein WR25_20958 isoform A [Diploscapter pachys]|uniref:DH domain-containing protein n=1 Tax=Diploscapter pachys TaxID=2018661 RepID=A0A2A2JX11_9BILA|nr:hypothetical protein WR25_20958 isoform A [Diploscapter pachys]
MTTTTRLSLNPNDADDSDSSDDSASSPVRRLPKRSATVSPSERHHSFRTKHPPRRRSDFNLDDNIERERRRERRRSMVRASRERSESRRRQRLRKTNSEPNVDDSTQIDLETLQTLMQQLPKFAAVAQMEYDSGGEDMITTEIEELKDAAKSIQSLQRVFKLPSQSTDRGVFSDADDLSLVTESRSTDGGRVSGICTKLSGNHPRGVMQFIPSIRDDQTFSSTMSRLSSFSRKSSSEVFNGRSELSLPPEDRTTPTMRRRGAVYGGSTTMLDGSDSFTAGMNRFSKLLQSLRSRQNSPEQHPSISWNPYYSESANEECRMEDSLLEADILLWKKRSRASLRRHISKYMRPLRQPLECTIIETGLVDKIFYKIPEILAHHQVLLAALNSRVETWHKDSLMGDVLLSHFSKQSMIETYISFVENFKNAKCAIAQARNKPSFEKYYNRCCRDHSNKLDLDALLISPIQRIPRYELLVKQLLKHTPAEHADRERLLCVQRHTHKLAVAINQHKDANEQMEQRLREIEAIVDGLDDLVTTGRTLLRYDMVTIKGRDEVRKQRCMFMLSDQLVLTSVRRKQNNKSGKFITPSADFLESNRFKLLIKISLDDVEIARDTLSILKDTENSLEVIKEDDKVVKKMIQLVKLLKDNREKLSGVLEEIDIENAMKMRRISERLNNDAELATVHLSVITEYGIETVAFEFTNAERRSQWEATFKDTKTALINQQLTSPVCQLKSIVAHQTRPGLQICTAVIVPGKRQDSAPFVWICASDKYSGQVAVISLENVDPSIESCSAIGNAAVTATCAVPPPTKSKKKRSSAPEDSRRKGGALTELNSSGDTSASSADEGSGGQTTVWIGNEDGDVYIVNSTDRIRARGREKVVRLNEAVTAMCYFNNSVFLATAGLKDINLLRFNALPDRSWDLDNPVPVSHNCKAPISAIIQVGRRLLVASGNSIHTTYPDEIRWQDSAEVLPSTNSISVICSAGAVLFISGRRSPIIYVIDAFTLTIINHFSIAAIVRTQLAGKEDILREHKMGSLRVSCITSAKSNLWIGTSAGFVLSTPVYAAKQQPNPPLTVCEIGHSGPCRVLLPISVALTKKQKRMSLTVPPQQGTQVFRRNSVYLDLIITIFLVVDRELWGRIR